MNSTIHYETGPGPRGHRPCGPQGHVGGFGRGEHGRRARHGGFGPRGGRGSVPSFGGGAASGPSGPRGRGSRARKGDVRAAILSLLNEAPASGYALIKAIAEKTDDAWHPSPGSVYPTLARLLDENLIEAADPAVPRSDYQLTGAGRAYVADNSEQLSAVWSIDTDDQGGQLRGSAFKLIGALRQLGITATPEQTTRAIEKIDQLRKDLYAILSE